MLDQFKLYLIRQGVKLSTISQCLAILKRVLKNTSLDGVDAYLLHLAETNHSPSYMNTVISTLHLYGKFLENQHLQEIPFFKVREVEKGILSSDEIEAIITLPPPLYLTGLFLWHYKKNSLLWKCCAYSGARIGEIATLTIDCVDLGQMLFRVDGKTGVRSIPINPALLSDLSEHIKQLPGKYLFPGMRADKPMERGSWNLDFNNRLKRLGIKRKRITPYSLRHTFITRMLDEDVNLFAVKRIVGHKQSSTTEHYYHYGMKKGQAAIRKDPLGRKHLSYMEKYFAIREGLRKLLSDYCETPEEEQKIREELLKLN